jgi:hypothetical protein
MATPRYAIRNDTAANWTSANPTLGDGEWGHESDTGRRKIGDGSTTYRDLPYDGPVEPGLYTRSRRWKIVDNTTNRTVLRSPDIMEIDVNHEYLPVDAAVDIDLDDSASWDAATYATPANRAGHDFYIYACTPSTGRTPDFLLSANATVPSGYTTSNSRKVGGFHCLCESVGSNGATTNGDVTLWPLDDVYISHGITGNTHWLNGYVAGDPLPFSVWDLRHRPVSSPEGMRYVPWVDLWVDIYLASWSGSQMQSIDGGTIADGAGSPEFHWYNFAELFTQVGKRLPFRHEFMGFAMGVPQGVNVSGSTDQGTTGGHTATDGKRIVSLTGGEDEAGVMWQWGADAGATNDQGSVWEPADTLNATWAYTSAANPEGDTGTYDHVESIRRGGHYEDPNRPLLGGNWSAASRCGSRAALWYSRALNRYSIIGARGVAEPYGGRA